MRNLLTKLRPTKRKLMQLYFALLFNANLKGFISGNIYKGNSKILCSPGINCYSCPGAVGACPLGSLQGSFSADRSTLFYVGGILVLYGLMLGRMICGWLCPFGLIQELVYKVKTPKLKKNYVTRLLSYLKYPILVFFVFIVPIIYAFRDTPLPAFCKYICPAGTLEGGIGLLSNVVNESYFSMLGPLFTWKFLLMVSILVGCVFIFRLFCRFLCPLGAFYGLFNKLSFFGIKVDAGKCTNCGLCVSHCKMDIRHAGDPECISCGECVSVCPTKAIRWKGPKLFIRQNEGVAPKKHILLCSITAVLLLGILAGSIVYYWKDSTPVLPPQGTQVGDSCYSHDLGILDKTGITGETINPAKTGKITVVNFWGTWCTPCVNELPYFDQIATDYADTVQVIAIHTDMIYETAPEFIEKYYPDSKMIFAKDYTVDGVAGYYTALGGRDTYPYTVILDKNGVILAKFVKALEYKDLQNVIEENLR